MIAVYATLETLSGRGPDLEKIVAQMKVSVSQREPGVQLYQLCRSQSKADTYHMLELYADEAALERHKRTDWYRQAIPEVLALLAEEPAIETYDAL